LLRRAAMAGDREAVRRTQNRFPDNRDVQKYVGIYHYRQKELAAAEEMLCRALASKPDDPEARLFLMRVHYNNGALDKCEAAAQALLHLQPDHGEALRTLGRIYNKQRAWADSASVWQCLTASAPNDAEAPFQAARSLEHLKRHGESLTYAQLALAANPQNGEAARIKIDAIISIGDGDLWPIVSVITTYYRFDPSRAVTLVRRLARTSGAEFSTALVDTLTTAFPDDPAVQQLAQAILEQRANAQARSSGLAQPDGSNVLDNPNPMHVKPPSGLFRDWLHGPSRWVRLAGAKSRTVGRILRSGAGIAAFVALTRILKIVPLPEAVLLRRAQALDTDEDVEELRKLLPQLVAFAQRDTTHLRPVGRLAVNAGALPEAIEIWSHLREREPEDDEAPLQLARCYARLERYAEAADSAAIVLTRKEDDSEAMRIRAKATLAQGKITDAVAATVPMILASPSEARAWLAHQPEYWTELVGGLAYSRAMTISPGRSDLLNSAEQAGIDYLGQGFAHELKGDLVGAFLAFHAAVCVRPHDQDAVRGEGRVKESCGNALRSGSENAASLLPSVSAMLLALSG